MGKQQTRRNKKGNILTIVLVIALIIGLILVLYPTVSNYWNSFHQTQAIASYNEAVDAMDEADYKSVWKATKKYNKYVLNKDSQWTMTDEDVDYYNSVLDIGGSGVMGVLEIPAIDVTLPIYHGVSDAVLQVAAGHLQETSLPIGGKGTHAVISGHRGLPSAKLFTDLDELVEGDIFTITVLDKVLTYEVDQIRIVEPDDYTDLTIDPDEDYVTLMTCTPYGINTHRLLVRGHRIATSEESAAAAGEAWQVDKVLVALFLAVPVLLIIFLVVMLRPGKRKKKEGV